MKHVVWWGWVFGFVCGFGKVLYISWLDNPSNNESVTERRLKMLSPFNSATKHGKPLSNGEEGLKGLCAELC
jgi:hypothetical protein